MADEEGLVSYREVLLQIEPAQCQVVKIDVVSSSDVTIKTDGHVKSVAAGGFTYKDSSRGESLGRNRFIHWRTSQNTLELSEESLDINLLGNILKIHFQGASLLPNVEIFETTSNVFVLAATTNSVHRFAFSHPNRLLRHDFSLSPRVTISTQSIFSDAHFSDIYKPWNFGSFSYYCISFSGWLCQDGHCLFSLITSDGVPLLVKLPPPQSQGTIEQYVLKHTGMMQRLWSGLVPSRMRGDGFSSDSVVSAVTHPIARQTCVFTLCRDYKIRIWACHNQECIAMKNLVDDIPDEVDIQGISGQTHLLKKTVHPASQSLYVGVFLSLPQNVQVFVAKRPGLFSVEQFSIYEVVDLDNEITLVLVTSLYSPKGNLVDFVINSEQIWTLWLSDDGVATVQYALVESSQLIPCDWQKVILDSEIPSEIPIPDHQEPREAYLEYLFYPGRFSKNTIDKAIKVVVQSLRLVLNDKSSNYELLCELRMIFDSASRRPLTTTRTAYLKEQVIALVDAQVQSSAYGSEILHEEFYDLQHQMWSRFYSCVVQYHEAANKPLGLFVDVRTDLVAIIRKEAVSFLRPCDGLETIYWNKNIEETSIRLANMLSVEYKSGRNDLQKLIKCIQLVTNQLLPEHVELVESHLRCGYDPSTITEDIARVLIAQEDCSNSVKEDNCGKQFVMAIEMSLPKIHNLVGCIEIILDALDVGKDLEDEDMDDVGGDASAQYLNLRRLFASDISVRILSSSLEQQSAARIALCRDLLILMHIIARLSARAGLHSLGSYSVTATHVPRAVSLLHTYYSLRWMSQQPVLSTPPNALESNLKQLAALEIGDVSNVETAVVPESMSCTVLELFLSASGGHQMRLLLPKNLKDVDGMIRGSFKTAIFNALDALNMLLWPDSPKVFFPEYLATKGQFQTLLEYCFVLGSWCTRGRSSRSFLQGQAHLVFGDYSKALDCFVEAGHNIDESESLFSNLLMYESEDDHQNAVQCFIKVMRLFEQFSAPEFVLKVADVALSVAEMDDRSLPIIWSNIFKHHLELGHNDEAYAAIISNPDIERKRDCLHRFVVVLCERGQRQQLVEYPYVKLVEEVVSIIEYHARTVDIATHTYYQLLYCFHTFRGNHRKAASSMFEYGMRLSQELPGLPSLQKQAKCCLAAMNSLRLVDPQNAWIVKPLDGRDLKGLKGSNMSPKRKPGDEEGEENYTTMVPKSRRRVTVLEICDVEKEYMLILARLQLLQKDADPAHATGPALSPDETLVFLVRAGLYDAAFSVANTFGLPLMSIFEGLAARCVKLSLYDAPTTDLGDNGDERTAWLKANDNGDVGLARDSSPADQAWHLLRVYLERFGSKKNCIYYKCVCSRLLSMGCFLPTWLINLYKVANPGELLQLFIDFDLLPEAASLALEYLNALMGHGKEYFGLEETLAAASSAVWFPYVALDQLLAALDRVDSDDILYQLRVQLQEKVDEYMDTIMRVSEDMIDMNWKKARTRIRRAVHD